MQNPFAAADVVLLRQRIAKIEQGGLETTRFDATGLKLETDQTAFIRSGHPGLDGVIGGFSGNVVHEMFGDTASGFALALAALSKGQNLVWIRQDFAVLELGEPYAPGLAAFGLKPEQLLHVCCNDTLGVLQASEEALRSGVFNSVIIETWGAAKALDLIASRRLQLASAQGQTTALLLRSGAHEAPSASAFRWHIRPTSSVPQMLVGLGFPCFDVELTRVRNGRLGRWLMEWNPHEHQFTDPLSRSAFSLSGVGSAKPPLRHKFG